MTIDEIYGAYRRLSAALTRSIDTAIEYGLRELDQVDPDLRVLEAGTFVLLFGVLEQSLRELAARRTRDARFKVMVVTREVAFSRVMTELKLPKEVEREIGRMETMRNDAAHGTRLARQYDIPAIVARIEQIRSLL